nr:MAG TPA: hypothetical protein [Caudoviricetes sp.]
MGASVSALLLGDKVVSKCDVCRVLYRLHSKV